MNMRAPVTTLPLMLNEIASSLNVATSQLGILTTIPLIMFVLVSNFAAKTMQLMGLKRAMAFAVAMILLGSLCRVVTNMPMMLIGTVLIGLGIAHLNVFMPSFVMAFFPTKIGLYTSIYTMSNMLGTAVFNVLTAPVMAKWGWHAMMWILVLLPALALGVWLVASRFAEPVVQEPADDFDKSSPQEPKLHVWRNPRAWALLLVFGFQAILNYTFVAWMPSLMAYHHVSAGNIGWIMALYSIIGMFVSLLVPNLIVRLTKRGLAGCVLFMGLIGLLTAVMLFNQNTSAVGFWLALALMIGSITAFFFLIAMTMFAAKTTTPFQTATVSGMAQSGGYFISAFGPTLYGQAFQANPAGSVQNIVYTVIVVLLVSVTLLVIKADRIFTK
ncbi:MFS transporter [Weissella viridescens]|uniref:MFS transporter n=2 Tax=Weissella viridescens TaxID=1629 RepID=A0A3P2RB61_WEIVI|nr:MFS transporter [Weissella viridescens]